MRFYCWQCAVVNGTTPSNPTVTPPDLCVSMTCVGCGPTFVNAEGKCVHTACPLHGVTMLRRDYATVGSRDGMLGVPPKEDEASPGSEGA